MLGKLCKLNLKFKDNTTETINVKASEIDTMKHAIYPDSKRTFILNRTQALTQEIAESTITFNE
jgi:hypothetical protein